MTDSRAVEIAESKVGFRLIMDDDKSSVLVTGTDGYIYLANTKENYDFSSPWGSVKPDSNVVDLDVLGRIVSYKFSTKSVLAAQVKVFKPSKVPKDFHARYAIHFLSSEEMMANMKSLIVVWSSRKGTMPSIMPSFSRARRFPISCTRLFARLTKGSGCSQPNLLTQRMEFRT